MDYNMEEFVDSVKDTLLKGLEDIKKEFNDFNNKFKTEVYKTLEESNNKYLKFSNDKYNNIYIIYGVMNAGERIVFEEQAEEVCMLIPEGNFVSSTGFVAKSNGFWMALVKK